jgi:LuxR family maltose regulon positive regulatory protein
VDSAAWVPVRSEERDPQWFWISVACALRDTVAGPALVRPLTAESGLDGWAIAERLLDDLGSLRDRIWLVIDDLHQLCSADALRQLEFLLMRSPPELRFVLVTRHDLRLGLHRLRLEGELTEIRAADLRFTLDEARALLETVGVVLPEPALALLVDRTEGWAARGSGVADISRYVPSAASRLGRRPPCLWHTGPVRPCLWHTGTVPYLGTHSPRARHFVISRQEQVSEAR